MIIKIKMINMTHLFSVNKKVNHKNSISIDDITLKWFNR